MPDPQTGGRRYANRRLWQDGELHRWIANLSNGRFHVALLVAMTAAFLIALVVPIRAHATSQAEPAIPVATGDDLATAPRRQAESVAGILGEAGGSPGDADLAYLKSLESVPGVALVPSSLLAAVSRIAASGAFASPQTSALPTQRREAVPFTVHEQGFASFYRSSGLTVGQALAGAGVRIGPNDLVSPAPETTLTSGLHVYVQHASQVDLNVGGEQQTDYTHAATVGAFLAEAGVRLEALDRVSPDLTAPIRHGMRVEVTTIREAIRYEVDPIHFASIYVDDPDLTQGTAALIQAGINGYIRREYRITYENGAEVGRERIGERIIAPVDQVIAQGTKQPPPEPTPAPAAATAPTMETPDGALQCSRTLEVYATWYTAASSGGSGITATGTEVYKGIVAVDPGVIPLGTRMYIPGYGYGLAADTGGAIIGNRIDLGYGPYDVYDWRTGWVEICLLD